MIVVTGATGNIGRSLVDQLLARGASVRALTRDPERAGLPAGAETVRADLTDPASAARALEGAESVFLNLAAGGDRAADAVIDAAVKSGVRRIVLNSSMAVTDGFEDQDNFIARMHAGLEQAVQSSGLEWTFVRGGMYATNALKWAPEIRETGVVHDAHPQANGAPVHEADLAAVAAAALLDTTGEHLHQAYVVTGPAKLTMAEQVAEIGRAIGREIRFEEIPAEQAAEAMAGAHFPKDVALRLLDMFASTIGTEPLITDTVQHVTGHPARTFTQWATDHAPDFR
ncbi:NAD(P)H-binding protein [Streptomyces sp. MST-110588]|uniref:NAD(P)H-binding protein n=1 Tax=Streptomyces sp. MST-110588 TaxID=2833628 RepID=UPI001F5DC0E1|nr:NAD(P)H-binding protein [Streptomyces sp. MST-110588]UNO40502.1 NAD(P)H-binding protein [Streptomyces sp. MST-110588]